MAITGGALATLGTFADLARQHNFSPEVLARTAAAEARLRLIQGDLPAAASWAAAADLPGDAGGYEREYELLTLARVFIRQRRFGEAAGLLRRLLMSSETAGRTHSAIEILILQSLALGGPGQGYASLALLTRALELAAPAGYTRIFIDEGAPLAALLAQVANGKSSAANYARKLLAAFGEKPDQATQAPTLPPQTSSPLEPLTPRESEVLRLINQGASNDEIAAVLVISIGTVKKHTHNLFGKL